MPLYFSEDEYTAVRAACARLIPSDDDPGATEAGVVDYIDGLLGAFLTDPPRIWAGGPFSGRAGGDAGFAAFHRLTALLHEHACEGMYAAPEYGGNRDLVGWRYIGFEGDVQPRGFSDEEVSGQ